MECLDQRESLFGEETQLLGLQTRGPLEQGTLAVILEMEHVPNYPVEKHRIMSLLGGVNVTHVLKAEEIADLPRGMKVDAPKSPVMKARPLKAMV